MASIAILNFQRDPEGRSYQNIMAKTGKNTTKCITFVFSTGTTGYYDPYQPCPVNFGGG